MKAQRIDPTVEDIIKALKACAKEECGGCYLHRFSRDGYVSTGETCFGHLALEAVEKLRPLELQGDAARSFALALELSECKQELERLKGEPAQGTLVWFEEEHGTPIDGFDYSWGWKCSICSYEYPDTYDSPDEPPTNKYCPNCGAKMEKTEQGDDMVMLPCMVNDRSILKRHSHTGRLITVKCNTHVEAEMELERLKGVPE